ncbi:polymer-forming cytoskeletal protein [Natronogracilivirgula saccharolytica]|uniref:Polymer-forming cytoskeletal protein n=2 Tax=Natronogracilivirga saccharolytica TaxID=2812953 RepID=A0A8J7UT90_9BACT|nr:polymer-forming cytoskeletal protein [Natronogracilivirga saccharolytica]
MFGKNNTRTNDTMKNDTPGQPNINMISSGSTLSGTLHTKSDLRVSGTVDGKVNAEGKCIVSESGLVKGDLQAKEADIAGTVEGEVSVSNKLILRKTAKVAGDIATKTLMVEEGAQIDGSCKMGDPSAQPAKKSASTDNKDFKKTTGSPS